MQKTFFRLTGAILLLWGLALPAGAASDDGLVLYFPFDQPPGSNVVLDKSGNGNHGTINGALFVEDAGRLGGACQFDGVDDFIHIAQSPSLDVGTGPGLTLSAWYNTSGGPTANTQSPLLEWSPGPQGTPGRAGVHMWVNTEGFQWHPPKNPGGGGTGANLVAEGVPFPDNEWDYVVSAPDRPRDEWHHVAVTYDRLSGRARVFVDGELAQEHTFFITPDTAHDLYLGTRPTDHQRLEGRLDEVRVYNRALSAREIYSMAAAVNSGGVYQNFEQDNGSDQYGWGFNGAAVQLSSERVHSGGQAWKMTAPAEWGGTGIQSQTQRWHFNAQAGHHDRLTFWIWADPQNNEPNNTAVKVFDHGRYLDGFEAWTTKTAQVREWTQMSILFTQLPADFDFNDIDKVEFVNFWPGTYYIDDIHVATGDRVYQAFEQDRNYQTAAPKTCSASDPLSAGNCGWAWFGDIAVDNTAVEGLQSWKLNTHTFWGGTAVKSQEQRLCLPGVCPDIVDPNPQQTFWHVDLNPAHLRSLGYDRLTFWMYPEGDNGMDNNMGVQFFDWGLYHNDPIPEGFYDKQVVWARKGAVDGQWTRLEVPLDALPDDFKLTDINKLQFQSYWPGTYRLDQVKAAKPIPVIDRALLPKGVVGWPRSVEAARYVLQESLSGQDGPWQTIYVGTANTFTLDHLSQSWLRVRWETVSTQAGAEAYVSDWSDIAEYSPQPVLINHAALIQGQIEVRPIPQADLYEIQTAAAKNGPWTLLYKGALPLPAPAAAVGQWYRARAVREDASGAVTDSTVWGPALVNNPSGYVKAVGMVLKEQGGAGAVITLKGVNLGNALLIEPWMLFGLNHPAVKKPGDQGYDPAVAIADDWTFREQLALRFSPAVVGDLLKTYQETYLQELDFDNILRGGFNVVRLPVYYRDIRELNQKLNWAPGGYNFSHIDRLIQFCADRGLYVLLDLHGAPGGQSGQDNAGRSDFNKLFNEDEQVSCSGSLVTVGECYRRRTVHLWKVIAGRYKNNTTVVGYDLLNEPAGAPSPAVLWQLYDRLYDAVRAIDRNHVIMMEGLWVDQERWPMVSNDWDWLPDPKAYNWKNVAYQFHYYCWDCATGVDPVPVAEQVIRQRSFLDDKYADNYTKQPEYDLPLMVGEFTGFGARPVWEDYLNRFNRYGWSWTSWAYKTYDSPSEWGLYTHLVFSRDLPDVRRDSLDEIKRKFSLMDTANHYTPNVSLMEIYKTYTAQAANQPPVLQTVTNKKVSEGGRLAFTLRASDGDGDGVMYAADPLPAGASLDPVSGRFRWTPDLGQAGVYSVVFSVSDGILKDQQRAVITVENATGM